jgi:negative regulator of flagellin synthesis FlgM
MPKKKVRHFHFQQKVNQEGGVNMRIEAYTQVQQLYNTRKPKPVAQAGKTGFTDALHISSAGKDFSIAKKAVAQADDIRFERVNPIKAGIANGTYQVSAEDFADRMIEKYNAYSALMG